VINSLLEITGGRGGWTAELWRDWCQRRVVEDVTDGRWRFASGEGRFDDVDDLVGRRLRGISGGDLSKIATAERLLACAALEGRRFTAPAFAVAGGRDGDETIDFFDDVLVFDGEHPDGFVVDDGFQTVSDEHGTRHLAMYRFARELDWLAFRDHGLSEVEERHLAPRLARAMEAYYGGHANRVALTLRRLLTIAGNDERSAYYRRMADKGIKREIVLWRAHNVLADADPVDRAERRRVSQLLIAAGDELFHSGPFGDGLKFARAAQRLAVLQTDRATAVYLTANHLLHLGNYDQARTELTAVLELYRELGDREGEARCCRALHRRSQRRPGRRCWSGTEPNAPRHMRVRLHISEGQRAIPGRGPPPIPWTRVVWVR